MNEKTKYRAEIDGLRAIVIVAVICYHLNPEWLKGGFLGVDVFFVISGFLITSIIHREMQEGEFGFIRFWARRVRRLYPVFFTVLAVVLLAGNIVMIAPERTELLGQSLASVLALSNIFFWKTTGGYWTNASEEIPLLHAWSLSVEEQFYIFFPPLLFWIGKARNKLLPVAAVFVVSLGLSIFLTPLYRSLSFYFLPTRAWELLVGSLLAMTPIHPGESRILRSASGPLTALGLGIIGWSFWTVENDASFPGAMPLPVCIATALILRYGGIDSLPRQILQLKPLVYIGKISYSLYLWHWPVIVLLPYAVLHPSLVSKVLLMFALAITSYHLVEDPFRRPTRSIMWCLVFFPVLAMLAAATLFFVPRNPWMPDSVRALDAHENTARGQRYEATASIVEGRGGLSFGPKDQPVSLALIGSSHARMLAPAFENYANKAGIKLRVLAMSGVGVTDARAESAKSIKSDANEVRLRIIHDDHPKVTLLAGMWLSECEAPNFERHFRHFIDSLAESSDKVYVLGQVPMFELPSDYETSIRKYILALARSGEATVFAPSHAVVVANERVRQLVADAKLKNVEFIDLHDSLSDKEEIHYIVDGEFIYSDSHHLNEKGASLVMNRIIVPIIAASIEQADGSQPMK